MREVNESRNVQRAGRRFVCFEGQRKLDTIHCKNFKDKVIKKPWWNSLGVPIDTEDTEPVEGSAGYSYCGLKAFCKLASHRLGMGVPIDSLIIAVCLSAQLLLKDKKLR